MLNIGFSTEKTTTNGTLFPLLVEGEANGSSTSREKIEGKNVSFLYMFLRPALALTFIFAYCLPRGLLVYLLRTDRSAGAYFLGFLSFLGQSSIQQHRPGSCIFDT